MPLKLNVGLSKKIGQPNYGSLGATCHLEIELDHALLEHDLEGFHERARKAFGACRQAVHDELARQQNPTHNMTVTDGQSPHHTPPESPPNGTNGHHASQKQIDFAAQLAGEICGLGVRRLESLAQQAFSKPVADLSSFEASSLINILKDLKAGKIQLAAAMSGEAE